MQRLLNDEWQFAILENGSTPEDLAPVSWEPVRIPHDFLIGNADDLYASRDGWYRRFLDADPLMTGGCVLLRFDGVYMDAEVFVNRKSAGVHRYGYTAFDIDLTGRLLPGRNEILVRVRHQSPNSRWYSGAGIFRDVTLFLLPERHIVPDGIYVSIASDDLRHWAMRVEAALTGAEKGGILTYTLTDPEGNTVLSVPVTDTADTLSTVLSVTDPFLWSPDHPFCYRLTADFHGQRIEQTIGFREFTFTTDHGLFINREPVRLRGVCLHHDLGCLGAAFHPDAARRQLTCMLDMGINALRTSHNPPAARLLDLCDEMGILVMDEAFDMWQRSKTAYDYARFFDECEESDVASWIRRDRNHPCILMWSIGNEIVDTQLSDNGQTLTRMLAEQVRRNDPSRNAPVTIALNYLPWGNAQKCVDILKYAGYNYGEKYYAPHHKKYPDWIIYGSETSSVVSSRGVYHFPIDTPVMVEEDLQCSALGNSPVSWGANDLVRCIVDDLNTAYSLGQFIWSGIDYIGEPTPYHTRSSYFGQADTAVFPKDSWYLFRSLWNRNQPTLHIGVYWDWNPGQIIDIPVMCSDPYAELFLNNRSLGRKAVNPRDPSSARPVWQAAYQPGDLCARSYSEDGTLLREVHRLSFGETSRLILRALDSKGAPATLIADGQSLAFVEITAADRNGNPVENAVDDVHITVSGGQLLGMDNGDSTDPDGYQVSTRHLFNGRLLAVVGACTEPGFLSVTASSPDLEPVCIRIPVREGRVPEGAGIMRGISCDPVRPMTRPIRKLQLIPCGSTRLTPENPDLDILWKTLPVSSAPETPSFRITDRKGIESSCASVEVFPDRIRLHAVSDGELYVHAGITNGSDHPRILSQLEISISGLGVASIDPYRFVSAGRFDRSAGDIGTGNEKGITFARDGWSMAAYTDVDFGPDGADTVTLPIFALDGDPYDLSMYLEVPSPDTPPFAVFHYQKPSEWNVYQEETYPLPARITGHHTVAFALDRKIHLKGFLFHRMESPVRLLSAVCAVSVTGDRYRITDRGILGIGNNVSVRFAPVDFGSGTRSVLTIHGSTPLDLHPITVSFESENGDSTRECILFDRSKGDRQSFPVSHPSGSVTVILIFLPGSDFDLLDLQFEPLNS